MPMQRHTYNYTHIYVLVSIIRNPRLFLQCFHCEMTIITLLLFIIYKPWGESIRRVYLSVKGPTLYRRGSNANATSDTYRQTIVVVVPIYCVCLL